MFLSRYFDVTVLWFISKGPELMMSTKDVEKIIWFDQEFFGSSTLRPQNRSKNIQVPGCATAMSSLCGEASQPVIK
jgi:hypothetical protein